jgi:hypothetical protein
LLLFSSSLAPPKLFDLLGFNLKIAWSRYFLSASSASGSPDFFDAKGFGFFPWQLWQGGAGVADALQVGFGVGDLRRGGWSAKSVADVVGGELAARKAPRGHTASHPHICTSAAASESVHASELQCSPRDCLQAHACALLVGLFTKYRIWALHLRWNQAR